jgi:peptidoglycan/LPS O-acetylase OafA/YrhL
MGQRSYTIYIWHALPFLVIMGATGGEDAPLSMQLMRLPFMAAATIAISVLVYEKVEMRVMRSKLRFTPDRGSKTAVLAAQADIKAAKPADFASPQPDGPPTGADAVAESATESAEPPAGAASVRPQRGATDL